MEENKITYHKIDGVSDELTKDILRNDLKNALQGLRDSTAWLDEHKESALSSPIIIARIEKRIEEWKLLVSVRECYLASFLETLEV